MGWAHDPYFFTRNSLTIHIFPLHGLGSWPILFPLQNRFLVLVSLVSHIRLELVSFSQWIKVHGPRYFSHATRNRLSQEKLIFPQNKFREAHLYFLKAQASTGEIMTPPPYQKQNNQLIKPISLENQMFKRTSMLSK